MGDYACGAASPSRRAYLEWLRQRVLGWTGRSFAEGEAGHRRHPEVVRRLEGGDPLLLVTALAAPCDPLVSFTPLDPAELAAVESDN